MYLFDASAIVNLAKRGLLKPLGEGLSLDLAVYEALNAVWKEHVLQKRIDADTARGLVEILRSALGVVPLESIKGVEMEVYELASRERLTVYDASYLYIARRDKLTLVSDDDKLLSKASRYVGTARTIDILKRF
jgi:predicted nucleic acid-binding protein